MIAQRRVYVGFWLIVLALILALTGCVNGSPIEPDLCTLQADSTYAVTVTPNIAANCPSSRVRTSVVR